MALVTTKEMFEKSMKEGFAIGAFNINNMEIIQGIVDAAAETNSPVILQTSASAIKYARINYLMKMVQAAVEEHPNIPIVIHLDHGPDFETAKMCIDNGFTSVMIDGSKYDFEENVALTKKVVDYAHAHGVVVEAELGGRVDHDVCAVLDGTYQVRSAKGVVNDQRQAVLVGNGGNGINVGDIAVGVAQGLQIDGLGVGLDGVLHLGQVMGVDKGGGDAKLGQGVLQQIVAAAVDGLLRHDVVACLS